MGGAHPTRTFWVSPTLRCPWTALGFGSGTAFCGFGFVFCGYGCAHLTRTGEVPHLTRTEVVSHLTRTEVVSHLTRTRLLRLVNAFGRACLGFMPGSALLSTSPASVVTPFSTRAQSPGARRRLRLSPGYFECFSMSVSLSSGRWRSAPSAPPPLRCPWSALGFGCGTAFCGFGFVFCGYGCAHLTRTGVVPHLTRTSLLRVVNAFGHRHVWGSCRSALLSTPPPLSSHPFSIQAHQYTSGNNSSNQYPGFPVLYVAVGGNSG